jgi:hypothetical protein
MEQHVATRRSMESGEKPHHDTTFLSTLKALPGVTQDLVVGLCFLMALWNRDSPLQRSRPGRWTPKLRHHNILWVPLQIRKSGEVPLCRFDESASAIFAWG